MSLHTIYVCVLVGFAAASSEPGPSAGEACVDITTKEGSWRYQMRRRSTSRFDPHPAPCAVPREVHRALGKKQPATDVNPAFRDQSCEGAWQTNPLLSRLTTADELLQPFSRVSELMWRLRHQAPILHRKEWEYVVWMKTVDEIGLTVNAGLIPKRTLAFAVGQEPTVSYLASNGVDVIATDAPPGDKMWDLSHQHMSLDLDKVNQFGIASREQMEKHVNLSYLDFNDVHQSELWSSSRGTFDFIWSICSVEHAGSIEKGLTFVIKSLEFLKPGGTALHTTEMNIKDMANTFEATDTVYFRKVDSDALRYCALKKGYRMPDVCYSAGSGPLDSFLDTKPSDKRTMPGALHLKLRSRNNAITTCIAWIIQKPIDWQDTGYDCAPIFAERKSGGSSEFVPPSTDEPLPFEPALLPWTKLPPTLPYILEQALDLRRQGLGLEVYEQLGRNPNAKPKADAGEATPTLERLVICALLAVLLCQNFRRLMPTTGAAPVPTTEAATVGKETALE